MAEEVIEVLKPLNTDVQCNHIISFHPASLPLRTVLLKSIEQHETDSPTVKGVAIRENLKNRYADLALQDFHHKCTVLNVEFKAPLQLDNAYCERISVTMQIVASEEQVLNLCNIVLIFLCINFLVA